MTVTSAAERGVRQYLKTLVKQVAATPTRNLSKTM